MSYSTVPLEDFQKAFGSTSTEISSVSLGGHVVSVSDEFFAEAYHLLKVEPAPSLKGQFGPKGALFSGWESRRHNPTYDWCIIKLGAPGQIVGFDIDTSHFSGNEAPQASVEALFSVDDVPTVTDKRWSTILPRVDLGPSSRHLFAIDKTAASYTHVKLNMYPDGGIARFRVYGLIKPVFPAAEEPLDLAHVFSGGRAVFTSDQHFGVGPNLLLPGRGKDMGDGWETKRSRQPNHKDWVIIKLGDAGILEQVEIDTAHFMGNYPESCEVHAIYSEEAIPSESESAAWTVILPRTKLGPHRRHFFQLENVEDTLYSHVRLTIYPDGGVKRVRVIGYRHPSPADEQVVEHEPTAIPFDPIVPVHAPQGAPYTSTFPRPSIPASVSGPSVGNQDHLAVRAGRIGFQHSDSNVHLVNTAPLTNGVEPANGTTKSDVGKEVTAPIPQPPSLKAIPAVPITAEAFLKFGDVVQAWADPNGAPKGVKVTSANQGTAHKYHRLSRVQSSYPENEGAVSAISVFRSTPVGAKPGWDWDVKLLERHAFTHQTFIPMGTGKMERLGLDDALVDSGRGYLVIVALNGEDDKPDLKTLRAFVVSTAQGITYHSGVWHHPMISLEQPIDFACVETQIGTPGNQMDCELLHLDEMEGVVVPKVHIPSFWDYARLELRYRRVTCIHFCFGWGWWKKNCGE